MATELAAAAGIGSLTNLFNSWRNRKVSKENTDKTIQANRELAEYQHMKNVEMWNMANEYNSPVNQMSRLIDAGLNPNMVYGNSSVVGNTSTQTPQYQAPRLDYDYEPIQLPDVISQYQDVRTKNATANNLEAQNDVLRQEALVKMAEEAYTMSRTARNQFELDLARELRQNSLDVANENLRKMKQDIVHSQVSVEDILSRMDLRELDKQLKEIDRDIKSTERHYLERGVGQGLFNTLGMQVSNGLDGLISLFLRLFSR